MSFEHATTHLNDDHMDALVAIAQAFGSVPEATSARVVALDEAGMDLDVEVADGATRQTRVPFNPAITQETVRERLVEMTRQAHEALEKS